MSSDLTLPHTGHILCAVASTATPDVVAQQPASVVTTARIAIADTAAPLRLPRDALRGSDGRMPPRRHPESGVTLIEMMVVLVIIGIVAALVVPQVIGRPDEARVAVAGADLRTVSSSLEMYRLDNRSYPTTAQGLSALTAMPTQAPVPPNWAQGGYLPNTPQDPWGNPYVYAAPATNGAYEVMSLGADGAPGGEGVDADIRHGPGIAATATTGANG